MADPRLPRRRRVPRHRRPRHHLRPVDQQRHQHRHRRERASTSRAPCYAQRRVHPGAPDRHPRRGQAAPHLRERARRGRPRLGAEGRRRSKRSASDVPEKRARLLPRGASTPGYGNLVPRDIATRELFLKLLPRGARRLQRRRRQERERGLPRPHAPGRRTFLRKKLAGILEIYEKFVGRRPVQEPDGDLPRRPLLDGRPVGRLRARRATARSSPARRATRRRTSPASTRRARSTTSTTAPIASAPTRSSRASTRAWWRARRWRRIGKNLGDELLRHAGVGLREGREARARQLRARSSADRTGTRERRTCCTRSSAR